MAWKVSGTDKYSFLAIYQLDHPGLNTVCTDISATIINIGIWTFKHWWDSPTTQAFFCTCKCVMSLKRGLSCKFFQFVVLRLDLQYHVQTQFHPLILPQHRPQCHREFNAYCSLTLCPGVSHLVGLICLRQGKEKNISMYHEWDRLVRPKETQLGIV